ncbi:ACT domain-containing protein [bacterium]|nr:ACT domain-containing protein [Verrucomicrobiota bacterium]MDA7632570.1 ACT domain-containing protein [bacterium]MDA7644790.1 ACT domain-containing protein [bacterium]
MDAPISNLQQLLHSLNPVLNPGIYVYCTIPNRTEIPALPSLGQFREAEGMSLILAEEVALEAGLKILFRAAWISLKVHSDLSAVGLTAAVSTALAAKEIPCNVVAGAFHDHLFVPVEDVEEAMICLQNIHGSVGLQSHIRKRN